MYIFYAGIVQIKTSKKTRKKHEKNKKKTRKKQVKNKKKQEENSMGMTRNGSGLLRSGYCSATEAPCGARAMSGTSEAPHRAPLGTTKRTTAKQSTLDGSENL